MIRLMDRMFLPVGHGAFYCERFWCDRLLDSPKFKVASEPAWTKASERLIIQKHTINIVYDCGTLRDPDALQSELEKTFNPGDIIDAVFISHLHSDHFNGLKHLADRCKIQRIYLPHMEPVDLRLMQLDYITHKLTSSNNAEINDVDFADSVLDNRDKEDNEDNETEDPIETLKGQFETLIRKEVVSVSDDRHTDFTSTGVHYVDNNTPRSVSVQQFSRCQGLSPFDDWYFKAFCIYNQEVVQTVKEGLREIINDELMEDNPLREDDDTRFPELVAELIENIKKGKAKTDFSALLKGIRAVYKKIGHFNVNSLVLYSGCDNTSGLLIERPRRCPNCKNDKPGCLYTGDFDAKHHWEVLENSLKNEWDSIGCIQIPHHGSEHNFNSNFLDNKIFPGPALCHVISARCGQGSKHPSSSVLKQYVQRCRPIVVTQHELRRAHWRFAMFP